MMRKARVLVNDQPAGTLEELPGGRYRFEYDEDYKGIPISLTMPSLKRLYDFETFPPFFEGLLPEGASLEALLKKCKLNRDDYFGQLLQVGMDLVGAVSVIEETK